MEAVSNKKNNIGLGSPPQAEQSLPRENGGANINNEFFHGLHHTVWRKIIPQGLSEAEVSFFEALFEQGKKLNVLDLMCGYGRHAVELGRRGHTVTALDNLDVYIDDIKKTAAAENLPVTAAVADVAVAGFSTGYDLVVCMGNSFAFFDPATAQQLLHNISGALKQGGKVVINTWTLAEIAMKYYKERDWFWAGDYKYITENTFHFFPSRIEAQHTVLGPNGECETRTAIDYMYTLDNMQRMFRAAGITMEGIYSTPKKKPFVFGDVRAYIVALKK